MVFANGKHYVTHHQRTFFPFSLPKYAFFPSGTMLREEDITDFTLYCSSTRRSEWEDLSPLFDAEEKSQKRNEWKVGPIPEFLQLSVNERAGEYFGQSDILDAGEILSSRIHRPQVYGDIRPHFDVVGIKDRGAFLEWQGEIANSCLRTHALCEELGSRVGRCKGEGSQSRGKESWNLLFLPHTMPRLRRCSKQQTQLQ